MSDQQWGPPPGQPYQQPYPGPPQPGPYGPPPGYGPPPPQYGWGPMPQPPPKKGRGGVVALAVIGLTLLGIGGVVLAVRLQGDDEPTATRPEPTWTSTRSVPTATTTAPPPFPTTAPTTRRTTYRPPTTRTTPTPKTVTIGEFVAGHRLYKTGQMRPLSCRESRAGLATVAKAAAYYSAIKKCLDKAWPRQVALSGEQFRAPGLIVFASHVQSPCGSSPQGRSFYCPTNHVIYMEANSEVQAYRQQPSFGRALGTHTMGHEYGHAMQGSTRILEAYYRLRYQAPTEAKKLEINRRMELQASCLGGVFTAAIRGSYPMSGALFRQWLYVVNNSGDRPPYPRDHGNKVSHGRWARAGLNSRSPSQCNTFKAPARYVS